MKKAVRILLVLMLSVFWPGMTVHAQVMGQGSMTNPDSIAARATRDSLTKAAQDSTHKKKRFYSRKVTYTIGRDELTTYGIDTGLDNKQYYDPAERADFAYRNNGNLGGPAMQTVFNPNTNLGFDLGYHQHDIYGFNRDNLKFFDSQVPYVNLLFLGGMFKEQMVNVVYNQNIGNQFNIGIAFDRYASTGEYSDQETNHNSLAATVRFHSKSEQYKVTGIFILNSFQEQENGGVPGGNVFYDQAPSPVFLSTNLTLAQSKLTRINAYVRQEWQQGKRLDHKINDTTTVNSLFPTFTIYHELEIASERYDYFDVAPINLPYYGQLGTNDDSLLSRVRYTHWSNTFGFTLTGIKSADSTGAIYRNYLLDGSVYYAIGNVNQDIALNQMNELRFNVRLRNHPKARGGLIYEATAAYNVTGYNNQDLKLAGSVGYKLKTLGTLEAFGSFTRKAAPWLFNHFYYPALQEDNNFQKTITFTAGLKYEIPKYHFMISGQFYNVTYPLYTDSSYLPRQSGSSVQAWVVKLEKNFRWRHFGSDNLFVGQFFTGQDIFRYPKFWSKNTLFYQNSLFKKNLEIRIGGDIWYNTNYFGDGYMPYTGQFYVQDIQNLVYYPVLDVFVSMKIAEAVIFLKFENATEGLFPQKNYFAMYQYPVPDRSFKVGVSWRFYE